MKRRFWYPCLAALMLTLLALTGCSGQKSEVRLAVQENLQENGGVAFSGEANLPDEAVWMQTAVGADESDAPYRGKMSVTAEQDGVKTEIPANSSSPRLEGTRKAERGGDLSKISPNWKKTKRRDRYTNLRKIVLAKKLEGSL